VSFCKPYNLNPIAVNAFYRRAKERLFDMRQDTNFGRQRRYVLKPAIADALRQKLG
jgi:hypothetical protein